jgi:hypothetical protein
VHAEEWLVSCASSTAEDAGGCVHGTVVPAEPVAGASYEERERRGTGVGFAATGVGGTRAACVCETEAAGYVCACAGG